MDRTCTQTDCNRIFGDDNELHKHKLETLHRCEHCHYIFKNRYDVKLHMRTHKIHNCTRCPRGFFLAKSLVQHMEMSTHNPKSRAPKPKRTKKDNDTAGGPSGSSSALSQAISSLSLSASGRATSRPTLLPRVRSASPHPNFITELRQHGSIETFLKDVVIPDSDTMDKCSKVVERVMNFLQHNTNLNVAKVYKGGSLAKGTSIKKKSDIDIPVFLNDYPDIQSLAAKMEKVRQKIKKNLDDATFADEIEFIKFTSHSLQFKVKYSRDDELHDIDLLPAIDVLEKGSKESVYRQMKANPSLRPYYSASFSPLQVDFVKHRPARVKDLIKLVKHWKRTEGIDELKSYSIELLVIKQWQNWGQPETFDLKEKLRDVLFAISNLRSMKITWPECYDIRDYEGLPNDKVVIMDPANPFTNTADRITRPELIEAKAREALMAL